MWLVVGLGNPGAEYGPTRHNAGFLVVQSLARQWGLALKSRACRSRLAEIRRGRSTVILALPQTYMNLSGQAVRALLAGYRAKPENLVVVYDDLDLDLGQIRVRPGGSPGSHRGMKSVVEAIGSQDFPRVRVGIGPKPEGRDAAEYVLEAFLPEEREKLKPALEQACRAVEMIIAGDLPGAMNLFNRKKKEFVGGD
ncbi:MAG: aminoacyl-tRNA hydrolase [Candidatus Saccharicenans sp.]|nr:aminoacyl-tRNA hydrolase [Candidatus Saccharicenans sp.]MDI6848251.1 aminoacyl-tRNA hydrolase [Candidatus Saccharicenans sp.]